MGITASKHQNASDCTYNVCLYTGVPLEGTLGVHMFVPVLQKVEAHPAHQTMDPSQAPSTWLPCPAFQGVDSGGCWVVGWGGCWVVGWGGHSAGY